MKRVRRSTVGSAMVASVLLAAVGVGVASPAQATLALTLVYNRASLMPVVLPGGGSTLVTAINASGAIAGLASNNEGFVGLGGHFTTFAPPGSSSMGVTAINSSGEVAGFYDDGVTHGFTERNGRFTTIDVPGASSTGVRAINDSGEVVGYFQSGSTVHGFTEKGGTYTTVEPSGSLGGSELTSINASGEVGGGYVTSGGPGFGFTEKGGIYKTVQVPGSTGTHVLSINASGETAGYYDSADGVRHGFTEQGGTFTTITPPGSVDTFVNGINDSGVAVGCYYGQGRICHGFVDQGGIFTTIVVNGSRTEVTAINNSGAIVGDSGKSVSVGFVLIPTVAVTLSQGSPTSASVITGTSFGSQLKVSNKPKNGGTLTWTTTSASSPVTVTSGGVISAPNTTPSGSYTVSGTMSDSLGRDSGSWTFTLVVVTH